MLYLTKNPRYERTKAAIVCFFELYHLFKLSINKSVTPSSDIRKTKMIDNRYDAFLASILVDSYDRFPENIRVISYNYDDQFERAYHNYLQHAKAELTLPELMNIYRRKEKINEYQSDKFSFFKINGSANFFDIDDRLINPYSFNDTEDNRESCIEKFIQEYSTYIGKPEEYKPAISFAWDSVEQTKLLLDNIKNAIQNTNVLVIIGYSFPFFNREIDKRIFESFNSGIKIYIQDPNAGEISERILSVYPKRLTGSYGLPQITTITNTKQFYLPSEL